MAKETTCDNLPNLNNGTISQGQKNVGAQRTIQCNSGFDLRGAASITCLNNGQWTIPGTCHISESCVKVNILNPYFTLQKILAQHRRQLSMEGTTALQQLSILKEE